MPEQPDALLVLGDTNSALSLMMAKRMRMPMYHMEAGNRCFDENVPEETNRRLVDHAADFNLAYTEHARRNLLAEGLHPRRVIVTGSPMRRCWSSTCRRSGVGGAGATSGWARAATCWCPRTGRRTSTRPDRLRMLLSCVEERVGC